VVGRRRGPLSGRVLAPGLVLWCGCGVRGWLVVCCAGSLSVAGGAGGSLALPAPACRCCTG